MRCVAPPCDLLLPVGILLAVVGVRCGGDQPYDYRTVSYEAIQQWKSSFHKAKNACASKGGSLLGGVTPEEETKLKETLIRKDWENVWMDFRKESFGFLTWTSGQRVDERKFDKDDNKCGFLNLSEKQLYETSCLIRQHYLCEKKGCDLCPAIFEECIKMNGSCYFYGDAKLDWYEAHNSCRLYGGKLAVDPSFPLIKQLVDVLWHQIGIKRLWFGSRTIDWIANDGKDRATEYHWDNGQPNIHHKCVVLAKSNGKIRWKTEACNSEANFVCTNTRGAASKPNAEPKNENVTDPIVTEGYEKHKTFTENGLSQNRDDQIFKVSLTLTVLGCLLLFAMLCAVVVYKKLGGQRSDFATHREPRVPFMKKLRFIIKNGPWGNRLERDQDQSTHSLNKWKGREDATRVRIPEEIPIALSS